jgi:predicted transcriptional regulator
MDKPNAGCLPLRRSRLETYEAILEALVKKPLSIDGLAYKVNMDCPVLKRNLVFLIQNGLVEERFSRRGTLYASTERGISVFKTLDFQRYLRKIQNTLIAIDKTMKVMPEISRREEKLREDFSSEKY